MSGTLFTPASGTGGGTQYDQSLNTTDDVTFADVTSTGIITGDGSGLTNLPAGGDGSINSADYGLPYIPFYQSEFLNDIDGIGSFNGGQVSYDSPNQRAACTTTAGAQGMQLTSAYANELNTTYEIRFEIELGTVDVEFLFRWGGVFYRVTQSGTYYLRYTTDDVTGGFGNTIKFSPVTPDTFYVSAINICKIASNYLGFSRDEAQSEFVEQRKTTIMLSEIYSDPSANLDNVGGFGALPTLESGQVRLQAGNGGTILYFKYGVSSNELDYVYATIDVEIVDTELIFQTNWGNKLVYETNGTGLYTFQLKQNFTTNPPLDQFCVSTVNSDGGEIRVNRILSARGGGPAQERSVVIGGIAESTYDLDFQGVVVGYEAYANQPLPTVVGEKAKIEQVHVYGDKGLFGCAGGDEGVAIGNLAEGGGYRTTAIGGKSKALGQSSTALGGGTVSLQSHGAALGRGTYVPDAALIPNIATVLAGQDLYFQNSWGHKFNLPLSGVTINDHDPATTTIRLHGQDAFDGRYPAWNVGTTYAAPSASFDADLVQHGLKEYKSIAGSTGVEPGVTAGWESSWAYIQDVPANGAGSGLPSDYNVAGGHIRLAAGRATGTGTGGTAGFQVCDGANLGENTKQALIDALTSSPAGTTSHLDFTATKKVIMTGLPIIDPGNVGELYNDAGTLKISAG